MDNSKIKNPHTFNGINCPNKYLYNKDLIYKLNCNDNFNNNNNNNNNNSQLNYNIRINNNINNCIHFSNSNDKERNTISNKSYGTIYLNKNKKHKNKEKNITLEILEKNQKSLVKKGMPSIQELNNKF